MWNEQEIYGTFARLPGLSRALHAYAAFCGSVSMGLETILVMCLLCRYEMALCVNCERVAARMFC